MTDPLTSSELWRLHEWLRAQGETEQTRAAWARLEAHIEAREAQAAQWASDQAHRDAEATEALTAIIAIAPLLTRIAVLEERRVVVMERFAAILDDASRSKVVTSTVALLIVGMGVMAAGLLARIAQLLGVAWPVAGP